MFRTESRLSRSLINAQGHWWHPRAVLLLLSMALIYITDISAQTATNNCGYNVGNEYSVNNNNCQFQTFNILNSFNAYSNPGGCSSGMNTDGWGWFTATGNPTVLTYDPEANVRAILHVLSGVCSGSMTVVACHLSPSNGINAQVVMSTVIGQQYAIRVQRLTTNGAMNGRICIYNPPANDECNVTIELPVELECYMQTFTNEGAEASPQTPLPTCGGTLNSTTMLDIWFNFYAPASGIVRIETAAGTLTDAVMQLYSGPCTGLTLVQCDDDNGTGEMPMIDRRCDPLTPFQNYRVRIFGKAGAFGTFEICVREQVEYQNLQEDCVGANMVCSSQTIVNGAYDHGCTQDLSSTNRGCLLSNERQGSWYYFFPAAAGTIEFSITPVDSLGAPVNVDYDFAIWDSGTSMVCPPAGPPLRCSYASPTNSGGNIGAGTFLTGLRAGETDTSEPSFNGVNGFVAPLIVPPSHVGRIYVLYVDNFAQAGQEFELEWIMTDGASLNCTVLPVEMTDLNAREAADHIKVGWVTMTESASDEFVVERSADGSHFTAIGSVPAAGYSQNRIEYQWNDLSPIHGISYYRLRQVDVNGDETISGAVTATYRGSGSTLLIHPNPVQDLLTLEGNNSKIVELIVFDGSSRIVWKGLWKNNSDDRITIDLGKLVSGSYWIRSIDADGAVATGRFNKY